MIKTKASEWKGFWKCRFFWYTGKHWWINFIPIIVKVEEDK